MSADAILHLRLFHRADPCRQIDLCRLGEAPLSIGRDPGAGWTIEDPDAELSRQHCVVTPGVGHVLVRDTSANGTFAGDGGTRLVPGEPRAIHVRQSFAIGPYLVLVDDRGDEDGIAAPATGATPPGAMLEAFCRGARLDVSALSAEEPETVMARAGEVYRQLVERLSELMQDRATARHDYAVDRTTIGAVDNNPFKWAPAERLATDLLRARSDGFLTGSAAVTASFGDVRAHLLAVTAAAQDAQAALLGALSPAAVEAELKDRSFVLKTRAAACWEHYGARHARLAAGDAAGGDGAFREAYARRFDALRKR